MVVEEEVVEEYIEEEIEEEEEEEKPAKRARLDLLIEFIKKTKTWYQLLEGSITRDQALPILTSRATGKKVAKKHTSKSSKRKSKSKKK